MKAMNFLLIPAFAALAVSCSNDETLQPEKKQPVVVQAGIEYTEVPATRTLFGIPTSEDGGKSYTIPFTWDYTDPTSEEIDVLSWDNPYGNIMRPFTVFDGVAGSLTNENKSMRFTGTYPEGTNGKCAYLYPSKAFYVGTDKIQNSLPLDATQAQTGNDNLTHLRAVNCMYSDQVDEGEAFTLKALGAILRFDLTFPSDVTGGTIQLSSSGNSFITGDDISFSEEGTATATYTGRAKKQSLTIAGISTDQVIGYMMVGTSSIHTGLQLQSLTLTATMTLSEGGTTVYTESLGNTTGTANWEPGKCYNFVVTSWDSAVVQ
jgi:hypothetical protein